MATKREVELIIRARDQAKAAVDGIVGALKDLSTAQENISKSGATANTAMNRLGAELNNLQKNASGLTSLTRLASNIDRATTSVSRMEGELRDTQQRLAQTSLAASSAAAEFGELSDAAREAGAALSREQQSLAQVRGEQARLNEEVAKAKARYQEWINFIRQKKAATDAEKASVRESRDALISLLEAQTRQNAAVSAQQAAVRAAGQAFSQLNTQARSAQSQMVSVNREFERAAIAARNETAAVEEAKSALGEMRGVANVAASALGGVEVKQEELAATSQRTAAAIQRVSAAIAAQQGVSQRATAQGGQRNETETEFKRQQAAVDQARASFRAAREDVARLRAEIAATAQPTTALTAEFRAAQAIASSAGAAFRGQVTALDQLRVKLREAADAQRARLNAEKEGQVAAAAAADAAFHRARAEQTAGVAALLAGQNINSLNNALRGTQGAANQAAAGIQRVGDQSRRALSLVQRFRGEVLSLGTQFVGVYAAISNIGGVIDAIRTVEAAASRLNAVFDGDQGRVREELRFISQEADRLGLSFRVLSQEYGRFSIAADAANFSNEATRQIFVAVAEAARVNKVSVEELEGTFLALQQMVSKGTVSMEELRRQLGDRLPGAFNIFADALGVTTGELDRMLRAGEVRASEQTLVRFAEELTERFGGALPAALETVTTQLDRFQNNLFEAQARVGQGGFTDALEAALRRLNEFFRSREGRDFFLELGAALGRLVDILTFVVSNFDKLAVAFQAFIAVRVGQFLVNLSNQMRLASVATAQTTTAFLALDAAQQKQAVTMAAQTNAAATLIASFRILAASTGQVAVAVATTGTASVATATAMRGLAAAGAAVAVSLRAVLISLGPIALAATAIFAISSLFIDTATSVADATTALDEHNRILSQYEQEVTAAERAGREFNATLIETNALEARGNLEELAAAYGHAREESTEAAIDITNDWKQTNAEFRRNEAVVQIDRLTRQLREGSISVAEYQSTLARMADEMEGPAKIAIQGLIARLHGQQNELRELEQAMGTQAAIVQRLGGDLGDLTGFYRALGLEVDATSGRVRGLTSDLEEQQRVAAQAQTIEADLIARIPARAREAERQAARDGIAEQRQRIEGLALESSERERLLGLVQEAEDAQSRAEREEDAREGRRGQRSRNRRDEQREFNDDLQRTIELRRFEVEQVARSRREQEIEGAVFEARARAAERGVRFSAEQEAALRASTAAVFDAEEAERVRLATIEQEIALREQLGQIVDVEQEIREQAAQNNINLATAEGQAWAAVTRQIIERTRAEEQLKKQVEDITALERQRQEAMREFAAARAAGELSAEDQERQRAEIERMRIEIEQARDAALELARALGDEAAIARLERLNVELSESEQKIREITTGLIERFASGASEAIVQIGTEIGKVIDGTQSWGDALENIGLAFRQFAAEFLLEIAKMIAKQAILNALQSSGFGGGLFGGIAKVIAAHGGGIAGRRTGMTRRVNPAIFANAKRFHGGGFPGLASNEVPAILKRGEEVVTETDPRHARNGGGQGQGMNVRNVNIFDAAEVVAAALQRADGERVIINYIRENAAAVNNALGR